MFQEENVCDRIYVIFSNVENFICFVYFQWLSWLLLLYKHSSIPWSQQIEKKDNGFDYSIYHERTVQAECPVISLLSKNAMLGQTVPSIDDIYQ